MMLSKEKQIRAYNLKYVIGIDKLKRFRVLEELKVYGIRVDTYNDLDIECLRNILECVIDRICIKYGLESGIDE